jgi:hypothetical protein
MRVTVRVVSIVFAFALGLALLGGCRRGSSSGVWSTSSPAEQGGLRLIAIQKGVPSELKEAGLHIDQPTEAGAVRAWFEVLDRSLVERDLSAMPTFSLFGTGEMGQRLQVEADAPEEPGNDHQYLIVEIAPGYGPEYVGGTLRANSGGKNVAEWKLDGMPEPSKLIADSEADVTQGKVLGYDVRLAGDGAHVKRITPFGEASMTFLSVDLAVNAGPEAKASKDPVEIETRFPRSAYAINVFEGLSTRPVPVDGVLPLEFDCRYPDSVSRAQILLKFRRYRTLLELITFRNVTFVTGKSEDGMVSYRMAPNSSQSVVTPSGLRITLPAGDLATSHFGPGLHVRLQCEQGYDNLKLPASPLAKSTDKPLSLSFGGWVNGGLSRYVGGNPKAEGEWTGTIPIQGKPGTGTWVLPELKLVVEQKAILEEEELKLLVPAIKAAGAR